MWYGPSKNLPSSNCQDCIDAMEKEVQTFIWNRLFNLNFLLTSMKAIGGLFYFKKDMEIQKN